MILNKNYSLIAIIALFTVFYFFSAWVADDAYITFRTIENFHHGYGLRWNTIERVQSYTHPLWMFNLLIGKYIINDLYYLSLILGYFYSVCTIYLIYLISKKEILLFGITALLFISSKAIIDFSSSGLENSLSYFLIALFFYNLKIKENHPFHFLFLSLILSMMFLNRMDLIISFIPIAIYLFFIKSVKDEKIKTSVTQGLLGFLPVVIWSFFALYYYGSFFANSVIAKTNTGLPITHLQIQGFKYFYENLTYDPYTSIIIYSILIYTIFSKNIYLKLWAVGVFFYCIYLINVGADYMYGRFMAVPFTICTFMLMDVLSLRQNAKNSCFLFLLIIPFTALNLYQYTFKKITAFKIDNSEMTDERAFYYRTTGLIPKIQNKNIPIEYHFQETQLLLAENNNQPIMLYTMGFNGYILSQTHPHKYVVDLLGLTDSFVAAHPMGYGYWRIGHFRRNINIEYLKSLQFNKNLISNPYDHFVLDQVWLLSRSPLNNPHRINAIINWHNGTTFKEAKNAFSQYPHHLLINHDESYLRNYWEK